MYIKLLKFPYVYGPKSSCLVYTLYLKTGSSILCLDKLLSSIPIQNAAFFTNRLVGNQLNIPYSLQITTGIRKKEVKLLQIFHIGVKDIWIQRYLDIGYLDIWIQRYYTMSLF